VAGDPGAPGGRGGAAGGRRSRPRPAAGRPGGAPGAELRGRGSAAPYLSFHALDELARLGCRSEVLFKM
jgi:hypothetical protein